MLRFIVLGMIAGCVTLWVSPHVREVPAPSDDNGEVDVRLPGDLLRTASGGFEAIFSDWYWLQAVQYFGTRSHADEYFRHLAFYLETSTDFDPDFGYAYKFGGLVIPQEDLHKNWHNIEASLKLLRKGVASHSTRWEIPYLLAYILYTYKGDYVAAADLMRNASVRPKAPSYLSTFVAVLSAQGHGDIEGAIQFTQLALAAAPDKWTREDLTERLKSLVLQQSLNRLNAAALARAAAHQPLDRLDDLLGYADLNELPVEPFEGEFKIEKGRIVSTDDDKLLHVFVHPGDPPVQPYVD